MVEGTDVSQIRVEHLFALSDLFASCRAMSGPHLALETRFPPAVGLPDLGEDVLLHILECSDVPSILRARQVAPPSDIWCATLTHPE